MITQAKWIQSPVNEPSVPTRFNKRFTIEKALTSATAEVSAMGCYSLFVNRQKAGDAILAPGWTTYRESVQYQSYDLTELLTLGKNELTVEVASGWACGTIGYEPNVPITASLSAIASITLCYADGAEETIYTDTDWTVSSSQITYSDIYHGETVDKTAPIQEFGNAILSDVDTKLIPQINEPVKEQERLSPVKLIVTPKGERVLDFGQNLAGYVEVAIQAARGARILLHFGEVLDFDGNFYNENMRGAKNVVTYICSGEKDTFKPTYSFQGFRYVHLVEYPFDKVDLDNFHAIVIHSDIQRTGYFKCGNKKINQLYHNTIWSQKSNFIDVPTDCPQRDERLGWTGDVTIFARTSAINYDVKKFFEKWLGDLRAEQAPDGAILWVVPNRMLPFQHDRVCAGWGDVCCVLPWELYLAYGDKKVLEDNFEMMQKWVDYMHHAGSEEYLWLVEWRHFGDWLATDKDPTRFNGLTPFDLIASAYFAYSTSLLVKVGNVLGKDMSEYEALYQNVRNAFQDRFLKGGKLTPVAGKFDRQNQDLETQTAYVLILAFGLCEEGDRPALAARLVEMIRENGTRMSTGFLGSAYILHVLSENGYTDVAYELLMQNKCPSWLYSVEHGATTIWEHWNGIREDNTFWDSSMNSFNHYAYGSVFDWIIGVGCGIKPTESAPGYKEFIIAPHPNRCLGFAEATIDTAYGTIRSYWKYEKDTVTYEFDIPKGATAYVILQNTDPFTLKEGHYIFSKKY